MPFFLVAGLMNSDLFVCESDNKDRVATRYRENAYQIKEITSLEEAKKCVGIPLLTLNVDDNLSLQGPLRGQLFATFKEQFNIPSEDFFIQALIQSRQRADKDLCFSVVHKEDIYTVVDKQENNFRHFFNVYYVNHLRMRELLIPCLPPYFKNTPEACFIYSEFIVPDNKPKWIISAANFHEIATLILFKILKRLHSHNLTHGDLTDSNIYFSEKYKMLLLADFKHVGEVSSDDVYALKKAKLIDIYDAITAIDSYAKKFSHIDFSKDVILPYLLEIRDKIEHIKEKEANTDDLVELPTLAAVDIMTEINKLLSENSPNKRLRQDVFSSNDQKQDDQSPNSAAQKRRLSKE